MLMQIEVVIVLNMRWMVPVHRIRVKSNIADPDSRLRTRIHPALAGMTRTCHEF
jgi:hypothetical protein